MTYRGRPVTIRRIGKKIRKQFGNNPRLKLVAEKILYFVSEAQAYLVFRPVLKKSLSPQEIQALYDYKKSQSKSSPKTAVKFQKDILSLAKGGFLTIEAFDAKLPDILTKLTRDPIERSAILLEDTDAHTRSDLKAYCDRRILPKAAKRSSQFKSRDRTFSPRLALEAFVDIKKLLDEHGVGFFLAGGTLLGAVRDGDFLPNDYNIDLGFLGHETDTDKLLDITSGSQAFDRLEDELPWHLELRHTNGVWVHLYNHFLDQNALCHRSRIHQWYNTPFGLKQISFAGTKVNIPEDEDLYLSENYGNWRDRICFFDFSYDTPNVKYAQSIESLEYFTERISNAVKNKWLLSYACSNRALKQAFGLDFGQYYPSPADGDIIDNPEPRKHLLLIRSDTLARPDTLIDNMIQYCSGTNIILDIIVIGDNPRSVDWLESFVFVDTVRSAESCTALNDDQTFVRYDALVQADALECSLFEEYPVLALSKEKHINKGKILL